MLFLMREILFEPPKKRGRKSQEQKQYQENLQLDKWDKMNINEINFNIEEMDISKVQVKIKTIQGYVTAICDLYQFQTQFEGNKNDHPRNNHIKKLLESVKKLNHKTNDESFVDRLKNTANDIISVNDYIRNATFMALKDSVDESLGIADRLDQLPLLSLMARSQITRGIRISEVGVDQVSIYDPHLLALRFTVNRSKTNQFERVLSVGVMRYIFLNDR